MVNHLHAYFYKQTGRGGGGWADNYKDDLSIIKLYAGIYAVGHSILGRGKLRKFKFVNFSMGQAGLWPSTQQLGI